MSKKTIAKFFVFVILPACFPAFFSGCSLLSTKGSNAPANSRYDKPVVVGTIKSKDVTESSGLTASKCQENVFWTHNDSGDDAFLYAINAAGDDLGTWKVPNVTNNDWEDIAETKDASGKCFIYIGEIGDNQHKRADHAIYRVLEPQVVETNRKSSHKDPLKTEKAEILRFTYPDAIQNCESLLVHPTTLDIYVISKKPSGPATIYHLKPRFGTGAAVMADKIGEITVPSIPNGLLTGGDISPDGKRVVLCDYTGAYELTLPDNVANFDEIWKQKPEMIELGERKQGEGITYSPDGSSIFATSEGKNSPMIEVKRKQIVPQ